MKTLFRILVASAVILLIVLVGGYFALTNAGVQKSLVERQLPAGSSIESIHITTGQMTLSGLVLMLSDGTRVQVDAVDTPFKPFAAIFNKTIKLGVLQVEGLRVDVPATATEAIPAEVAARDVSRSPVRAPSTSPSSRESATNPMEVLYALGDFKWLFDIEGIKIEGVIYDEAGFQYVVHVDSPAIRPGQAAKIDASLKLLADVSLPSGLKSFDSTATLRFKQKIGGGFESLRLESNTLGEDVQENHLISVHQDLDLTVDDTAGVASVSLAFDADLPKPQILAPELAQLGALKITGNAVASTDGITLTLSAANLKASAAGSEVLALDLKRSMVFGGTQDLSDDLLDITLTALPLEWLNPWLSDGLRIKSKVPASCSFTVAGAPKGAFVATFAEPIKLGPLTVTNDGGLLLQDVSFLLAPKFQFDANGVVNVSLAFDADLPNSQTLAPELTPLGALKITGNTVASTDGITLTLSAANLKASAAGSEVLALDLKRSMVFGGTLDLSGDLLDITLTALPLEWLNPWLSDGLQIKSKVPASCSFTVAGAPKGAFVATFAEPIKLGPLTVTNVDGPLLQNVTFLLTPELQLRTDQSLQYVLNSLSVANQQGAFIQGTSSGVIQFDATRNAVNPFAGIQSKTKIQIGLKEAFQLPLLAGSTSIASGQLALDLDVDESSDTPFQLQAKIKALSASSMPNRTQDYAVSLRLKPTAKLGEWAIGANVLAGSTTRPSTSFKVTGVADVSQNPVKFSVDLLSPHIAQEDLSILSAAFTPIEQGPVASPPRPSVGASKSQVPREVGVFASQGAAPSAAWSMLKGRASLRIDEFRLEAGQTIEAITLEAVVSEPKLMVDPILAKIGEGKLSGSGAVLYTSSQLKPYNLTLDLSFVDVDPAFFADKNKKSPPLQGQFDGVFEMKGVGESIGTAIEDSTTKLKITGEDGMLTAFELDGYKQVGFGIVQGLLGRNSNPGVAALSGAIPYFKDIRFDDLVFELTRGVDKQVLIPQLRLTGDSILMDATGSVGASSLSEVMSQPLDLKVTLGAKGDLTKHLETLQLLQPIAGEDGFRRWNQDIGITGTLANPNTDELKEVLFKATKEAFSEPKKKPEPPVTTDSTNTPSAELAPQSESINETPAPAVAPEEPKKKSKEERRREDIETGLDLLNSFLGK